MWKWTLSYLLTWQRWQKQKMLSHPALEVPQVASRTTCKNAQHRSLLHIYSVCSCHWQNKCRAVERLKRLKKCLKHWAKPSAVGSKELLYHGRFFLQTSWRQGSWFVVLNAPVWVFWAAYESQFCFLVRISIRKMLFILTRQYMQEFLFVWLISSYLAVCCAPNNVIIELRGIYQGRWCVARPCEAVAV